LSHRPSKLFGSKGQGVRKFFALKLWQKFFLPCYAPLTSKFFGATTPIPRGGDDGSKNTTETAPLAISIIAPKTALTSLLVPLVLASEGSPKAKTLGGYYLDHPPFGCSWFSMLGYGLV